MIITKHIPDSEEKDQNIKYSIDLSEIELSKLEYLLYKASVGERILSSSYKSFAGLIASEMNEALERK